MAVFANKEGFARTGALTRSQATAIVATDAAYRIGDSPMNVVTPLMVYLPFIVTVAQRYKKDAGLGTVIALMIPYSLAILVAWIVLFVIWFTFGIPLGPGYPVAG